MQTQPLSVTLGLLFKGGAAWQCGQVWPRKFCRDVVMPSLTLLLTFSNSADSTFLFQYSEKCLMMLMYLETEEQSLLLLYKAINVHKLYINGLVSFFTNCAE